jgi:putative membrane protein insertion efficiency factor
LSTERTSGMSLFAQRFIRTYQVRVSPRLGSGKCRFEPTCSNYALSTYKRHGFLKASVKSLWRILRCNPLNKGDRLDPP